MPGNKKNNVKLRCVECGITIGNKQEERAGCDKCGKCVYCCACIRCDKCGKRFVSMPDDFCDECNCCNICCICYNSSIYKYSEARFKRHYGEKNLTNKSNRLIGVEIETSNILNKGNILNTIGKWKGRIVEDGSIDGVEINSAPASGDRFIIQMKEICNALDKDEAEVDTECGLHEHIDARDFSWYSLRRIIKTYILVEKELYACVSQSRQNNHNCRKFFSPRKMLGEFECHKSCKSNKGFLMDEIWSVDSEDELKGYKYNKYHDARYYGLNLHSWLYRKTFEFRMHQGTINCDKITSWALILCAIVDYAHDHTEKCIDNLSKLDKSILHHIVFSSVKNKIVAEKLSNWIKARKRYFKRHRN